MGYDSTQQREIACLLTACVAPPTLRRDFGRWFKRLPSAPAADAIFVYFQDFEWVAVCEVHDLTARDPASFDPSLDLGDQFWCTKRLGGPPIVFVQTEDQAAALKSSPLRDKWADDYYEIAKRHDEFGYLDRADVGIMVDSKENFETNYAANWYYYFK